MNNQYPNPIDNARYIPSSLDEAHNTYQQFQECGDMIAGLGTETFLRYWFALHFITLVLDPDDFEHWPAELRIYVDEARMRHHHHAIDDDQLRCHESQDQGLRLQRDGNLRCYAVGTLGEQPGYISATYDPEHGSIPVFSGVGRLAYIYESPAKAALTCRHLALDKVEIYAGTPDRDLDYPPMTSIPMRERPDV